MMGIHFMGEVPFREVYIHALVRDPEGQKMSKSKGNVIDPLELMDKYGTDAFRFSLAAFAAMGRDVRLSEERIAGYRNFANKVWNACRFTFMNLEGFDPAAPAGGADADAYENPDHGGGLDHEPPPTGHPGDPRRAWTPTTSIRRPTRFTSSSGTSSATGTWNSSSPNSMIKRTRPPGATASQSSSRCSAPFSASCTPSRPS